MLTQMNENQKFIVLGKHGQKWTWPLVSHDTKIGCNCCQIRFPLVIQNLHAKRWFPIEISYISFVYFVLVSLVHIAFG